MSQGRGSAMAAAATLCLLVVVQVAEGVTYTVGGPGGWTFNVSGWPRGKSFKAGDVLVFNYSPAIHNVVAVNKGGYDNCSSPPNAKVFRSGKDQIKLVKGQNFFICTLPGHCSSGMKISITAA